MSRRGVERIVALPVDQQSSETTLQRWRGGRGRRGGGRRASYPVSSAGEVRERGASLHGRLGGAQRLLAVHAQAAWGQEGISLPPTPTALLVPV